MAVIQIRNHLRYYRTVVRRLTQKEAAALSGMHRLTLSRIETNLTTLPQMETQRKLAKALNIPVNKLFSPQKFRKLF